MDTDTEDEDSPDFTNDEMRSLVDDPPSRHPLDHLRSIVLEAIMQLLSRQEDNQDMLYFALLCKEIPHLATDFAVASSASGRLFYQNFGTTKAAIARLRKEAFLRN
jgi:hypothetical protein